jgi:uncharacterized protein YneF (UPF0154 family)
MKSKTFGIIVSLILVAGTVGGFFWLWTMSKTFNANPPVQDNLKTVEIESVKKDAENVLSGLEKNSDIPISTPVDKMGKTNPFVIK